FIGRLLKWHQKIMGENFSNFDFDANDLKILSFKLKKPELNLAVCAKEIGLHRNTVSARWKKIVKEKLIMKKSVIINPEYFHDLGIGLNALMLVESEVGETENLASKLVAFDEVHELGIVNSRFDIVTSIRVKDVPSLYSFQNRLFASESINRLISATETIVVLSSKRKKLEKRGDLLALTKSK
ncbi:MAG TPA: Lrp/AsnC family transcriptional regulator, partial [archaeon]|nr:Lrp/AsnC family transcriptional regulator [archaeon]